MILVSCSEQVSVSETQIENLDNVDVIGKVEVKDGLLHFSSPEFYKTESKRINALSEKEYTDWMNSIDFTSYESEYYRLSNVLNEITVETEFYSLIEKNKDILKIDNETVMPVNDLSIYSRFANREGMFYVSDALYVISLDKMILIDKGTPQRVLSMDLKNVITDLNSGVLVQQFNYSNNSLLGGRVESCGPIQSTWSDNGGNITIVDGDRKVNFTMLSDINTTICCYDLYGNPIYTYQYYVRVYIYAYKKNWLGKWVSYNTNIYFENGGFNINVPQITGSDTSGNSTFIYVPFEIENLSGSRSEGPSLIITYYPGDCPKGNVPYFPIFQKVKGDATSRGTGTNYAHIYCW
ncbi:MAG: hypothetical protein OEW75_04705 [Cyclobacteriaceae bacterium]|nr:hypothetical protein [Cyclobacteriaceae bacterium]